MPRYLCSSHLIFDGVEAGNVAGVEASSVAGVGASSVADVEAGSVTAEAEYNKRIKYQELESRYLYVPLAIKTTGTFAPAGCRLLL